MPDEKMDITDNNIDPVDVSDNKPEIKDQDKKFSQEELDRIIKDRLRRENEKHEKAVADAVAEKEAEFSAERTRLSCKEYLFDKQYPAEFLDVLDTSDLEAFTQKADKINEMIQAAGQSANMQQSARPVYPGTKPNYMTITGNQEVTEEMRRSAGFARDQKHKPAQPDTRFVKI